MPGVGTSLSGRRIGEAPEILRHLRGDNPELRAAVRTALTEATAAGEGGAPDADLLARIDLAGDLGAYLDRAVARRPGATLLARVRDAVHRWNRANDAVIDAVVRDVEAGRPDHR